MKDLGPSPKRKMKNFNWNKVKTAAARAESTVWRHINFGDLNIVYSDLEMLFGKKDDAGTAKKATTTSARDRNGKKGSSKIGLIDPKRQHNISITLSRLSIPPVDIVTNIMNFQTEKLNSNAVELLKLIAPEPGEINLVKEFLKNPSNKKDQLKAAERFIAEIITVPRFNEKITVFDLFHDFDNQVEFIAGSLEKVKDFVDSVLENEGLKRALGTILMIGNFINHGNFRGAAEGFEISSLEKLAQLRTAKPKECQSLLHFVAAHAQTKDPKILGVKRLNFNKVASISMTAIKEAKLKLQKSMKIVTMELKACESSDSEVDFLEAASPFQESARVDFNLVEKAFLETSIALEKLSKYFCIDVKKLKFESVVGVLKNFVGNFNKAIQENERALLLKKKREKLEGQRLELASKKDGNSSIRHKAKSGDDSDLGDGKTVDRLLSSMRNGDGDMFKRRRDSMNKRKTAMADNRVGSASIEDSIAVLRQKVASKWDSDEDGSSDSTDDEWD